MNHKDFVDKYKNGKLVVFVDRNLALKTISAGYVPSNYYWAHTFWSWVWFLSMPIGIIFIFIKGIYVGLGILLIGFMIGSAAKKSAQQFILQHALDNEPFYNFCIKGKVLVIEEKTKDN